MQIKHIIIIVAYGVICFVASLLVVQCSEKAAQKAVKTAEIDAERARADLDMALAENARLNENMAKYDGVLKQAITAIEKAYETNAKRIEEIHDLPSDWLQCELPSELQDLFAGYCDADGCNKTAIVTPDAL